MKKDYYAILGVKRDASDKEIRSAYKRLARRYHPDVNPNDKKAAEKFREITEAYEVLGDPEKRRAWEQGGGEFDFEEYFRQSAGGRGGARTSWSTRGAPGGNPFGGMGGFGSILEQMMGGMGGGATWAEARGNDLGTEITLPFEDAIRGTTLTLPLARMATCRTCQGTGAGPGGRGGVCPACRGAGTERSTETIQVRIPPGVESGGKVRVAGKGEAGMGGAASGDLLVTIVVTPHAWFRREGADIVLDLPLSFKEAALGAQVQVPTLTGRVTLTVPPGSRSGQRLRLRGKGVPARGNQPPGDQIVVLQIVSPKTIDERSRTLLEELDRQNPANPRGDLGW